MKAKSAFTSKMAPHIERYLALKTSAGSGIWRSPPRTGAHRSVCNHTRRRSDRRDFCRLVFDVAAFGIWNSPGPHEGSKEFLSLQTSL